MTIEDIYQGGLEPVYPEATEAYLCGLPAVDTHNFAEDYAKRPVKGLDQALDQVSESVRKIEVARRAIAGTASWLAEMVEADAPVLAELSPERRAQVEDLAARVIRD